MNMNAALGLVLSLQSLAVIVKDTKKHIIFQSGITYFRVHHFLVPKFVLGGQPCSQ